MPSAANGQPERDEFLELPPALLELNRSVIGAAFEVYSSLGHGLLEGLYESALMHELELRGHAVERQVAMDMKYKGKSIGTARADIVIDGKVVVELKVADAIVDVHKRQALNYIQTLKLPDGLIVNFNGPKTQVKRVVNFDLVFP